MAKSKKILHIYIVLASVIILTIADQLTKVAATALKGTEGVDVIKGVFKLYYLENTGTAWGMFAGARVIFLIITLLVVAAALFVLMNAPCEKRYVPLYISITLLVAGGIGNFIDRLMMGYVRDFLYFSLIDFPVFNVADSYVTIGLILLIILILFVYNDDDFSFLPFVKSKKSE